MGCASCGGKLTWGSAPFGIDRHGYHVHWDAVPAWICDQCGEAIFELEQVDMIQRALDALDRETRSLAAATPAQSA